MPSPRAHRQLQSPAPTPSAEVVPESVVAIETPTPAVAEAAPVPSAEILLESTASAEAAPAPTPSADAQVVPESAAAVETMSSPAPTAELAPVAAAESAPAPAPAVAAASGKVDEAEPAPAPLTAESETIASKPQAAVVSDAIAVPVSESTATKVDAAVAPAEAAVEKPTESVAVPTTDDKPVATTSTPEAKPRLNGPVKGGADRRSRTISALKEEDGKAQNTAPPATATPATNIPPREQRKSIFGRIASIFRTSSLLWTASAVVLVTYALFSKRIGSLSPASEWLSQLYLNFSDLVGIGSWLSPADAGSIGTM
ncbi:hypothetical protein BKA62DRAFT_394507 [Auriculariales sp. MPI-PUGE-AT-0066]|nr:hypothetical protein BKA62DRAFT_394507 [Auriculariales sp. MPI-PUGE-AT-0066]